MVSSCLLMQPAHKESQVNVVLTCFFYPCSMLITIVLIRANVGLNIVVEQISGRDNILNHLSIPAACFTHPEISMVGLTEVSALPFSTITFSGQNR